MSGLIERLRSGNTHNNQTWFEMCCEAADEIERLRAELAARDAACLALYEAGKWELHDSDILPHEQAVMWQGLRDAMGLEPGHATAIESGAYKDLEKAIEAVARAICLSGGDDPNREGPWVAASVCVELSSERMVRSQVG